MNFMKLEDLTDIMIAQIPGRLYSEMKKITTILADELSDITKKRFGVEVMGYEVSSYFVPVMALILDNRLGLMGFAGSCLMRAFCYKAIKSMYVSLIDELDKNSYYYVFAFKDTYLKSKLDQRFFRNGAADERDQYFPQHQQDRL